MGTHAELGYCLLEDTGMPKKIFAVIGLSVPLSLWWAGLRRHSRFGIRPNSRPVRTKQLKPPPKPKRKLAKTNPTTRLSKNERMLGSFGRNQTLESNSEIDGRRLLKSEQYAAALELLDVDLPDFQLALLMLQAGKADETVKKAGDAVRARKGEVLPLAQTEILHAVGRKDEARTSFDQQISCHPY